MDRYGWMTVAAWVMLIWAWLIAALIMLHHRRKSGQWRPYTNEEVEDPDWDRKH